MGWSENHRGGELYRLDANLTDQVGANTKSLDSFRSGALKLSEHPHEITGMEDRPFATVSRFQLGSGPIVSGNVVA
jgi:hypothetical protein